MQKIVLFLTKQYMICYIKCVNTRNEIQKKKNPKTIPSNSISKNLKVQITNIMSHLRGDQAKHSMIHRLLNCPEKIKAKGKGWVSISIPLVN